MIALIITSYNRPNYLSECFKSLLDSNLSLLNAVFIVDDNSTDNKTIELINLFVTEAGKKFNTVKFIASFLTENVGIKKSLLFGYEFAFKSHTSAINLDADAVVSNNWLEKIIQVKNKYPDLMVSGFHCNTLNSNGSVRHKTLYSEKGIVFRVSVGGINLFINKEQYHTWVKPSLLELNTNWDHKSCLRAAANSMPIAVTVPSVIQHIGKLSSMGHATGGEPMDEADDFKRWYLDDVSLIAADDNPEGIIKAANISCKDIQFASVKLLSCGESFDPRIIKIKKFGSKRAYSEFFLKHLYGYIDTQYFITIQADGYILNGSSFNPEWTKYDYIGSPWEWYADGMNTGNGACSFRSRWLHKVLKEDPTIVPANDQFISEYQEDHNICRIYRKYLEENFNIKFAPIEVARRFGIEAWNVKPPGNKYTGQFGFHGKSLDFSESTINNKPY